MPHWELSWQLAAIIAACMFSAAGLCRLVRAHRLSPAVPFLRECGLVVGLYALWQYAGTFSVMSSGGAIGRARWLWRTERAWHLPSEAVFQHFVLPHRLIVEAFNIYYASMHFTVLIIFLVWLFIRHRQDYRRIRPILVCFTAASLLIQLVPVAPPRLLTGVGLTDTAALYHQSVYALGSGVADQYSAMPSVHVGWAMLIAVAVWRVNSGRGRWLATAHALITWIVVVATANHFWLDGIVATALLLLVLLAAAAARTLRGVVMSSPIMSNRSLVPAEMPPDKLSSSAEMRSMGGR